MTALTHKPDVLPWTGVAAAWKAALSPERLARDEAELKEVFALTGRVPILKEALDWAQTHGVEFLVDRTAINAGGYYTDGTGVVVISQDHLKDCHQAVNTIVHEIRHAWQDYHGMLSTSAYQFQGYFMRIALLEADARAHGRLAATQYLGSAYGVINPTWRESLESGNYTRELWKEFIGWYTTPSDLTYYGSGCADEFGFKLGVPGINMQQYITEYQCETPITSGLDLSDMQDIFRLGRKFGGGSYFPRHAQFFFETKALQPGLAFTFHNTASYTQRQLVAEVRKRQIRHKLEHGGPLIKVVTP